MPTWRSVCLCRPSAPPSRCSVKIRFCEHNKGKGKVYRRLKEEFPDLNIKIKECVKQCSACREMPMATVDKEKITARDGDGLYDKIVATIREKLTKE
ncbi:DUF1450 domain-containing protein [Oryzomonas japonica]|uniref:DUF1450 domain-containing protein n=1 Tax=Oryzomonas japonica TaxID=2603858 RepID=A0A7J4ZM79_9BACT|nr:DUF1450 domain-containing protein [Oryzomonas japonica]